MITEAGNLFASSLKDIPDAELVKHPFKIEHPAKSRDIVEKPAARTNLICIKLEQ